MSRFLAVACRVCRACCWVGCVWVFVAASVAADRRAFADNEGLERFWREAPAAWQKITSSYEGKAFDSVEKLTDRLLKPIDFEVSSFNRTREVHCLGDWSRIDSFIESVGVDTSQTPPPNAGPAYLKKLDRKTESEKGSTICNEVYSAILSTVPSPSLGALYHRAGPGFADQEMRLAWICYPALVLGSSDLLTLSLEGLPGVTPSMEPLTLRVTDANSVDYQGKPMVELRLEYSSEVDPELMRSVDIQTKVVLDPARLWGVVHYEWKGKNRQAGSEFACTVDTAYSSIDANDFHPEALVIIDEHADSDGIWMKKQEFTFSRLRNTGYARADCYLTAFGLPEPSGSGSKIYFIGMLLTTSLGLLLLWWRHHAKGVSYHDYSAKG